MLTRSFVCLAFLCSVGKSANGQSVCASLPSLRIAHVTIMSAALISEGPYTGPPEPATPASGTSVMVPAHCEVRGQIRPSADSDIRFVAWLPVTGWNGKYRQQGNSGWAGVIPYADLIDPLRRGYATAATDDGHDDPNAGFQGAKWAIGHPEKVIDFGYRAVHETSVAVKAILLAFYGRDATTSYFVGCSEGGREALMEAQRYPEDFDGVLAADPAGPFTQVMTGFAWNQQALRSSPRSVIPPEKLAIIQAAVLSVCDTQDSARDGLLDDPRRCRFDPSVLACRQGDRSDCLTAPQLETLRKLYAGPTSSSTGERIFWGYLSGSEAVPRTWSTWINTSQPELAVQAPHVTNFFGHALFETDDWDYRALDLDRDFTFAKATLSPILDAVNPDLRSFRAHGGKLLQYHGWADVAIPAMASVSYYETVSSFLARFPDGVSRNPGPVADFYRLFLVPGMGHCGGGVGPIDIGNVGLGRPVTLNDPVRDAFSALELWVEQAVAPDQLIGIGPRPLDPSRTLSRPVCAYPMMAIHNGTGDIYEAGSFRCELPNERGR